MDSRAGLIAPRCSGQANIVFCDGHVHAMRPESTESQNLWDTL